MNPVKPASFGASGGCCSHRGRLSAVPNLRSLAYQCPTGIAPGPLGRVGSRFDWLYGLRLVASEASNSGDGPEVMPSVRCTAASPVMPKGRFFRSPIPVYQNPPQKRVDKPVDFSAPPTRFCDRLPERGCPYFPLPPPRHPSTTLSEAAGRAFCGRGYPHPPGRVKGQQRGRERARR